MYHQEMPHNRLTTELIVNDPMLGNYLQRDLIELLGIDPMVFVTQHAEKFRTLFEQHPEWKEMYAQDKEATLLLIKEILLTTIQ